VVWGNPLAWIAALALLAVAYVRAHRDMDAFVVRYAQLSTRLTGQRLQTSPASALPAVPAPAEPLLEQAYTGELMAVPAEPMTDSAPCQEADGAGRCAVPARPSRRRSPWRRSSSTSVPGGRP
ncbi:MAG: hypothetical protein HGA44_08330, partial [Cellulomonadaceae bacterium]|nr:hypothetical protein [Cellulomonadaceae bacterium]